MNKVSFGAWGTTIVWVGIIGFVTYTKRGDFGAMQLNAVGDFLAGTVSPLALIWLVAGYLQQGKELQLNTQALLLQHIEMKNQVEEFKKLAIHAEEQAAASVAMVEFNKEERMLRERAASEALQPRFEFEFSFSVDDAGEHYTVVNLGEVARDIEFFSDEFDDCFHETPYEFLKGDEHWVLFQDPHDELEEQSFSVEVHYIDISGTSRTQKYNILEGHSYPVPYRSAQMLRS